MKNNGLYLHSPTIKRFAHPSPDISDAVIHSFIDSFSLVGESSKNLDAGLMVKNVIDESARVLAEYSALSAGAGLSILPSAYYNPLRDSSFNWKGVVQEIPVEKLFKNPQFLFPGKNN